MRFIPPARAAHQPHCTIAFKACQRRKHQPLYPQHEAELAIALIVGALMASVAWSFAIAGVTP